jgi:hypothetical protein
MKKVKGERNSQGQTDGLRREVRPLGLKMLWATVLALYSADAMLYPPSSGCDR